MTGTIKHFNAEKGWGFITGEDGKDYFFHHSALKNTKVELLYKGQDVTAFEETSTNKGLRAEDIFVS